MKITPHKAVVPNDYTTVIYDRKHTWNTSIKLPRGESHDLRGLDLTATNNLLSYVGEVKIEYPTNSLYCMAFANFDFEMENAVPQSTDEINEDENVEPIIDVGDIIVPGDPFVGNNVGITFIFDINKNFTNKYRFIRFVLSFEEGIDVTNLTANPNLCLIFRVRFVDNSYNCYKIKKLDTLSNYTQSQSRHIVGKFTFVFDSVTGNIIDETLNSDYQSIYITNPDNQTTPGVSGGITIPSTPGEMPENTPVN